jgi:hypothetical protein
MRALGLTFVVAIALAAPLQAVAEEAAMAPAARTSSASTAPAQTDTVGPDQVMCEQRAAETASHPGGRRECHTQREWQRMRTAEQQQLFRAQVQFAVSPRP